MELTEIVSLITNVGFPVTLCMILIRYVLQTIGEKLEQLDSSIKQLSQVIQTFQKDDAATKK